MDDHLSDDQDEEESSFALKPHHKPLGKHRLLWGKPGNKFPATCLLGPDWPCLLLSFILIWGTTLGVMFGISLNGPPFVYLVGAASLFLVTFFLSGAAFSDPGIIPKKERSPTAIESGMPPPNDPHTGQTLCSRCLVYRPRGAFHCRDCDACILDLDRELYYLIAMKHALLINIIKHQITVPGRVIVSEKVTFLFFRLI